jgi:ketosteroid isomerase-like protein
VEEIISSLEKGAMERWRQGDPWGWAEISAADITYIDPGLTQPIIGLEAYKAYLKQIEGKVHYQGSEFIGPRVVTAGDAAVLTYNYRSTTTEAGRVTSQTLWNTTEVYFQLGGEWKIAHTHWSFVDQKLPSGLEVPVPVQMSPTEYGGLLGELMAPESAGMERWRKGDPWGAIENCASEVTYFDVGTSQRLNGLEALKALYAPIEGEIHFDVMEFIDPRVQRQGDLAVLMYRFFSTTLNPDGSISHRTPWNCSEVFVRVQGHWRIIHTHWSFIKGERA